MIGVKKSQMRYDSKDASHSVKIKRSSIMPVFRFLLVLGMSAAMAAAQSAPKTSPEIQYAVVSPWAEVDSIPLKGISPRVDNLAGKKIGIFVNYKRAARPISLALENKLKAMLPSSEISFFHSPEWNVSEIETKDKDKFTAWAKGVNAVILLVGD
jgi:hypothetical protein